MKRANTLCVVAALIIMTVAAPAASLRSVCYASAAPQAATSIYSTFRDQTDRVHGSLRSRTNVFTAPTTVAIRLQRFMNSNSFRTTETRDLAAEIDGPSGVEIWTAAEQHLVTVESLRVHYIESGTGRAVVMIHGNAGGVEDFELGVMQLLSREYRVIAIDRPGHGSSDRPAEKSATVEYQAQLLHRTLSHLGVAQPVLIGHSWGAALALAYALKYPDEVSALVLLAPAAYPDAGVNGLLRMTIRTPVLRDLSLLLGRSTFGRRRLKRDLARAFYPQMVPENYFKMASSSWLGRKQFKAYLEDEWSLNDSLKKMSKRYIEISIPVVIVTGAEDKIVSPKENAYRLQTTIRGSQLIELKNAGHEIPQTHPDSVYAALALISSASDSSCQN